MRLTNKNILTKARKAALSLSARMTCALLTATTAFADDASSGSGSGAGSSVPTPTPAPGSGITDIWGWLDFALKDLYNKFLSVSTIAACVAASLCLILMNFSTDDRAVATSRAWLKRILVSWVILNVLGFIMAYLVNLTQGGSHI